MLAPLQSVNWSRRDMCRATAGAMATAISTTLAGCHLNDGKHPTILLCSGWQVVNIGDIAHTPGILQLLQQHVPDAKIILWTNKNMSESVTSMLLNNFPDLEIIQGQFGDPVVDQAAERADMLLHGSGPSVVAHAKVRDWRGRTDKPYGIFGVTIAAIDDALHDLLCGASFIFTRETHSIRNLREANVTCPIMEFAPDATFAFTLRDEEPTANFMRRHGLEDDAFICVVPRLRKTPYYKIYPDRPRWTPEVIREVDELNARHAERDHEKVRVAIIRYVRETGGKVAVVPEMTYQLDIMDELLIDPLPDDVKQQVVKRVKFWLPDEAASLYARAVAVLSFECHSPIIAVAQGTPAFYLRQPEDTIKGQMWYDIGLTDWVFEIDETTGEQIADRLMDVLADRNKAKRYLNQAIQLAERQHLSGMAGVKKVLG